MNTAFAVKLAARIICACLGLVPAASAQGLPPGVLLLARVKAHMRETLARLPNCSCLETVHREHQPAGGRMRPLDTIRLEVLYSDRKEYYASPAIAVSTTAALAPSSAAGRSAMAISRYS